MKEHDLYDEMSDHHDTRSLERSERRPGLTAAQGSKFICSSRSWKALLLIGNDPEIPYLPGEPPAQVRS